MILLKLFLAFLKIGAVSFGGGYGMISLIKETVVTNSWLTEEEFLDFVAVSESTPGPIAINLATFVGSSQAGFLGALISTIGVVIPAFLIILAIVSVFSSLIKYKIVDNFLYGIRPVVCGLIVGTAVTMMMTVLFSLEALPSNFSVDIKGIIIFAIIALSAFANNKIRKKKLSPILLILISAVLGILFYM